MIIKTTQQKTFLAAFLFCMSAILSCNIKSNSLKQDQAEKTIRNFVSLDETMKSNAFEITDIGKTNIFSQFNTSVKVTGQGQTGSATFLFIFTRTAENVWYLTSVEPETSSSKPNGWSHLKKKTLK